MNRQGATLEIARELAGHEARVGQPAIDMRRELLELAREQTSKARLEPLGPLDDKEIMNHLHQAHAGSGLQPNKDRDILLLPP